MHRSVRLVSASVVMAASLAAVVLLGIGTASAAPPPNPNPWLGYGFLNMAHQGGEDEAPSNTLFAFKSAMRDRGADTLELDVNLTSDNELVVIHDDTVNRTTEVSATRASEDSQVIDLDLAEVQALDAGYSFSPGSYSKALPASSYPYRGMANDGGPTPPAGYTRDDFQIPTMREVLDAFPTTPLNIEIKLRKVIGGVDGGCSGSYCDDTTASIPVADALAALLDEPQYASRDDIIVVSFSDGLVERFHDQDAGGNVALAPGRAETTNYLFGQEPDPGVAAFQIPSKQQGADPLNLFLNPAVGNAHGNGYAVHVWANGDEGDAGYQHALDFDAEGYMASEPGKLAAYLCLKRIPRPDGTPRCVYPPDPAPATPAKKKCKKGSKLKKGKCVKKKKHKKHKKHRSK